MRFFLKQYMRFLVSPCPHPRLVSSHCLSLDILANLWEYLFVVSVYISLMTSEVEPLFLYLLLASPFAPIFFSYMCISCVNR